MMRAPYTSIAGGILIAASCTLAALVGVKGTVASPAASLALEDRVWDCIQTTDAAGTNAIAIQDGIEWSFSSRTHLLTEAVLKEGTVTHAWTYKYTATANEVRITHLDGSLYLHLVWQIDANDPEHIDFLRVAPAAASQILTPPPIQEADGAGMPISTLSFPTRTVYDPQSWRFVEII